MLQSLKYPVQSRTLPKITPYSYKVSYAVVLQVVAATAYFSIAQVCFKSKKYFGNPHSVLKNRVSISLIAQV